MRKLAAGIATALALAFAWTGPAAAQPAPQITLRLGHILPVESPDHRAFLFMAERIKALTNSEIAVQIFPSSQLGAVTVMIESMKGGSLDMMVELLEFWASTDRRFGIFGLPYLFDSREQFARFLNTPTFRSMADELGTNNNLVVFGNPAEWQFQSDRTLLATRPIIRPADIRGIKLRMFQARVPVLTWQTLGANTVIIPWAETYTALATGTVEAVTARVEAHYQTKQTEVAKYMTVTEEYYQAYMPIMSRATERRLKPEQLAAIRQAASEAGAEFMRLSAAATLEYRDRVRNEHGVTVIYPPLAPWQDAVRPIHARFEQEGIVPAGLIAQIRAMR